MRALLKKLAVFAVAAALVIAYFALGIHETFTFERLKGEQERLQSYAAEHGVATSAAFFGAYVLMAALSLPGAAVMTLAAGVIFGFVLGTVLVSFSSSIGATLAFLVSRFLFREKVQQRFGNRLKAINEGIRKEGAFYLFTLRLIPLFPFFVINLVFGLTSLPVRTFYWVSQVGMLAGTAMYVNAGTQLSQIESASGILSPGVVGSFVLIGLFPLVARRLLHWFRARKVLRRFSRPAHYDYNVVVLGAGSGGLVAAYIAAAVRAKVALIEKERMGGDCLNTGCVPSKALIRSAAMVHAVRRAADWGFRSARVNFDFGAVMERVQRVVREVAPHDSVERYTALGVECVQGEARILDPWRVQVGGRILTTRNIVLATGARPLVPPIPGVEEVEPLTSDTLWDLRELPARLVVVGGGPIGCELAQCFARFGAEVTVVEAAASLLPREDRDAAELVQGRFEAEGLRVLTGHAVTSFAREGGAKVVVCASSQGEVRLECDEVLMALGRRATVTGFGLEELGVELRRNGTVEVDDFLQTNYPGIFACGDVTGPYQFTHVASHQAWYAAVNALFRPLRRFRADYRVIPWATFTDPEVARVGLNEAEAREQGVAHEVVRYDLRDLDRAIADGDNYGMVKVLTPPGKDRILGVTIVGPHAADLLAEYVTAMKHGIGLNKILGTIHVYPTLAEANKYAAGAWKQKNKPEGALRWVERWHRLRRSEARSRLAAGIVALLAAGVLLVGVGACRHATVRGEAPDPGPVPEAPVEAPATDAYAAVLQAAVAPSGLVDYAVLQTRRAELDAYSRSVAYLERRTYDGWSDARKIAFWCNVYNALTLEVVLENWPIQRSIYGTLRGAPAGSIRQIPWVWDKVYFPVMGEEMSLGHIEHAVLREEFDEPRIHMAINCASVGCPPLRSEPFSGERLDDQLEDQTRRFLEDPGKFRVDRERGVVFLSPIFSWFGSDFVGRYLPEKGFGDRSDAERAVLHFIAQHQEPAVAAYLETGDYRLEELPYDWSLNRAE